MAKVKHPNAAAVVEVAEDKVSEWTESGWVQMPDETPVGTGELPDPEVDPSIARELELNLGEPVKTVAKPAPNQTAAEKAVTETTADPAAKK